MSRALDNPWSEYFNNSDQYDYSLLSTPASNTTSCNFNNETGHPIFSAAFEGIPETLGLNFIGWLIILILFTVLRKRAWNYGRIALVQKTGERWTQIFYGTAEELTGVSEAESLNTIDSSFDKGFCSWVPAIFRTTDENILARCGPDAVQYLSFQRHIIFYMSVVMVISLAVVLPINYQGTQYAGDTTFAVYTVANLDPNSAYLWIHVTLSILYLPLGILLMRRFSMKMKFEDTDTVVSRTLMITNIPPIHCDLADLHRHFREAYPEMEVQDIQLAYDIAKVSILDKKREAVYQAKLFCEDHFKERGTRLDMRPYVCGNICGCCTVCGCPMVDAIEYYASEESRLRDEVENERIVALKRPLGIAFITFPSVEAAQKVFSDHRPSCKCANNPPSSSLSRKLEPTDWKVTFAPSPKDIFWENLSRASNFWYIKAIFINLVLFVFLFFLTTPAVVISVLNKFMIGEELQKMSPILSDFLPTLLLWTVAALMPVVVAYSDQWVSHWTRSEQNHSIMFKTLTLLFFMVLILPSFGLASAETFLRWTISGRNESFRWECLFLPDKGAFFVNYVTTSAFIGTGLELIRFPELFVYVIQLALTRSPAEMANVRKAFLREFPFGVQYAWMLLIFGMTTMYCLSCPLITPIGTLYMVLKHLVDRHNIYFAYGPSKISPRIHATAINAVIVSITLLQLSFMALAVLRRGFNDIAIFAVIGFCLSCIFLFAQIVLQSCKGFSPISYQKHRNSPSSSMLSSPRRNLSTHQFVPPVLQTAGQSQASNVVSVQSPAEGLSVLQRTYGTQDELTGSSPDAILSFEPAPTMSSRDLDLLYQDYDGSNTEV